VDEEHGYGDFRQVRRTEALRLSRWMKRVSEKDDSRYLAEAALRCDLRSDASAHRLAPDEDSARPCLALGSHRRDRSSPGRFEHVGAVGDAPLRVGVEKIESDDLEPPVRERVGHGHHPGMALGRPSSMPEHEDRLRVRHHVAEGRSRGPTHVEFELHGGRAFELHGNRAQMSHTTVTPSPPRSASSPWNRAT
jgi:hypothetical protein